MTRPEHSRRAHAPEDIARARAEIRARQQARTRQRILGLRAADRTLPVKEIAYRAGVSAGYVEQVLAQAAAAPPFREGIKG